jgi:hypoxanthine phosphoribosyltransferase
MAAEAAPAFAHASEAEMGRILDFYGITWHYEPHTFPILWNLDGDVVESFSPDFYLPDLDLYLEMTTLRQRLVRKKNRKLRRLREIYPDIRIKLFYARDFRALMLKYGKLALIDTLSGSAGQVGLPEPPVVAAVTPGPVTTDLGTAPAHAATNEPTPSMLTASARRRRRRRAAALASADEASQGVAIAALGGPGGRITLDTTEGSTTER